MINTTNRSSIIVHGAAHSAAPAAGAKAPSLRDALIGAWRLVSCVETDVKTGEVFLPMGEHPQGFILYTPDGYMSAQLSAPDRAGFASGDMYRGRQTTMSPPASVILLIPVPIMSTRRAASSSTRWR